MTLSRGNNISKIRALWGDDNSRIVFADDALLIWLRGMTTLFAESVGVPFGAVAFGGCQSDAVLELQASKALLQMAGFVSL